MANNVIFSKQFLFVIWTKRLLAFLEKKESCIETAKVLLLSSQKKRQRSLFWGCFEAVFFLVWWETTTRRQGILTHRAAGTFRDMGTGPHQFYQIHYPNSNQDGERLCPPNRLYPHQDVWYSSGPDLQSFSALTYHLPCINTPIMLFKEQLKRELDVK